MTPTQGPRGQGQKNCAVARPIHVSHLPAHTQNLVGFHLIVFEEIT